MTNDVPLREFVEVKFNALEKVVDTRMTGVETAVKAQTVCIETLDEKREENSKAINGLKSFRKGVYYLGGTVVIILTGLLITFLAGMLF